MTSQWKLGLICTCGVYPATRSCWCKRCSCGWYCKKADLFDLREDMLRIKPKFAVRFPTCLSWAVDTKLIYLAFRNSRRHMTKLRKLSQSWSLKIRFVSWAVDTKLIYLHSGTLGILWRRYENHQGAGVSKSGSYPDVALNLLKCELLRPLRIPLWDTLQTLFSSCELSRYVLCPLFYSWTDIYSTWLCKWLV